MAEARRGLPKGFKESKGQAKHHTVHPSGQDLRSSLSSPGSAYSSRDVCNQDAGRLTTKVKIGPTENLELAANHAAD